MSISSANLSPNFQLSPKRHIIENTTEDIRKSRETEEAYPPLRNGGRQGPCGLSVYEAGVYREGYFSGSTLSWRPPPCRRRRPSPLRRAPMRPSCPPGCGPWGSGPGHSSRCACPGGRNRSSRPRSRTRSGSS